MFPLAYAPQAAAIALGLRLHAPFLALLYAARLMNLFLCLWMTWAALRIAPVGKYALAAANLLPMAVYIRAQTSTDGLVLAAASLALALLLKLYEKQKTAQTQSRSALICALSTTLTILAACKSIYLVVFAFWAALPKRKTQTWIVGALSVLPALALAFAWGHFLSLHDFSIQDLRQGLLSTAGKDALLLHAPGEVALRILRTLGRHLFDWTGQMIGILGSMDIPLSLPVHFAAFFWLCGVAALERPAAPLLTKAHAWSLVGLFWIQVLLVIFTLFLIWGDPASRYIGGVQGRYFLPLLPCLLIGLSQAFPKAAATDKRRQALFTFVPALFFLGMALATARNHTNG